MIPIALIAVALLTPPAQSQSLFNEREIAEARQDPEQFTLDEKTLAITKTDSRPSDLIVQDPNLPYPPDGGIDPGAIINIGQKIWDIIVANKPVVDVKTQYASAVPSGLTNWLSLSGWKVPEATTYVFSAKNAYGVTVVNVRYVVVRTYGGSYLGKGKYLTGVTISPLQVDVVWGYKFSLSMEVPDSAVVNAGTAADPVAGMDANIKWNIQTPIKESQGQGMYYVQGDGLFKEIGRPFTSSAALRVSHSLAAASVGFNDR
jgi:hypothetical protein